MKYRLTQNDIEDLLAECGTSPTYWNNHGEMMVCCPVHGEVHPSMGVNSEKQICHCFACGFAGDFPWLLYNSQPDQYKSYKEAKEFIESQFDVKFEVSEKSKDILRYEDLDFDNYSEGIKIIPRYKIAPYRSGKETYKYFFRRGFTQKDMIEYMIGRDLVNKTVTIPVFAESGELAGVIGRFVDKNRKKNERYKIYDHFNRGKLLYPVDKFVESGRVILVEGQFDAIRLRRIGFSDTLAKMGLNLTREQANWIVNHCDRVVYIGDRDERGQEAKEKDKELLRGRVDFLEVEYPDYGKDVCDWTDKECTEMIENAGSMKRRIKRYD